MIDWLRADLAAANAARAEVPWIVALGHKAWWMDDNLQCPSGPGCSEEGGSPLGELHM